MDQLKLAYGKGNSNRTCTYSKDIHDSQDKANDSRGDNDTPEGDTESLFACGLFVEITEYGAANDDHQNTKSDEARGHA